VAPAEKRATIVDRHLVGTVVDPDDPDLNTRRVRTGDIIPQVAVDPNSGAIYAVWQDARFGPRSSIAFARSLDGGVSWSPTIKVNKTPTSINLGNQQAFTPVVRVLGDGTVGVTYYDFRNNTPDIATLGTDRFVVHCHPTSPSACTDPANWGSEVRLTDETFNMRQAPFARGWFVGDYVGTGTDGSDFLPFWSQPFGADPSNTFIRRVGLTPLAPALPRRARASRASQLGTLGRAPRRGRRSARPASATIIVAEQALPDLRGAGAPGSASCSSRRASAPASPTGRSR
jgi:hypothetical protein